MTEKTIQQATWIPPVRNDLGRIVVSGRWEYRDVLAPKRMISETVYQEPRHFGDKGRWVTREQELRDGERIPHKSSGFGDAVCWILGVAAFLAVLWVFSLFGGDDMRGKCQGDLGYGGQVEWVDCEP